MSEEQKKLGYPPGIAKQLILKAFHKYEGIFNTYQQQQPLNANSQSISNQKPIPVTDTKKDSSLKAKPSQSQPASSVPNESQSSGPEQYSADPECYNGAVRDQYSWSQSIKDMDVRVKVPEHVTKGRDITVNFGKKTLFVAARNLQGCMETIIDGELSWEVNRDDCIWTLVPNEHIVHISLDKVQERWWECVLKGEDKINTRQIDCSRPMHELDDEAQAKIQQMMYDQEQKRLGKPTSQAQNMQEMLRKAWDADGSPFKGQPFDPNKLQFSGDGSSVTIKDPDEAS